MAKTFSKDLWTPRSVSDTKDIYDEWAETYDTDVLGAGYATPARVAEALASQLAEKDAPILDFGCGTGLSGLALKRAGFTMIDGTDISPEMVLRAEATGVYRRLWVGDPEQKFAFSAGDYAAITATGVISLGAAPPDLLPALLDQLGPGGYLALSYNDATLQDQTYLDAMERATRDTARLLSEAYGAHLPGKDMKSTVYLLQKH